MDRPDGQTGLAGAHDQVEVFPAVEIFPKPAEPIEPAGRETQCLIAVWEVQQPGSQIGADRVEPYEARAIFKKSQFAVSQCRLVAPGEIQNRRQGSFG